MNPVRCSFIRKSLCEHFRLDPSLPEPLAGLRLIDVGCGGGLLSESLARMGASVTAVDATETNIHIARAHSDGDPLLTERITYRAVPVEELVANGEEFDAVLCLEVIEHVRGPEDFCKALGNLAKDGGALIMSTMNRTPLAYTFAIVGAEYITHVVPPGTHDWEKFVTPEELTVMMEAAGMELSLMAGMQYNPVTNKWKLGNDVRVNYIATYVKELQCEPAGLSKPLPDGSLDPVPA